MPLLFPCTLSTNKPTARLQGNESVYIFLLALLLPPSALAEKPIEVDISHLKPGQLMRVKREDGPIWILYRTAGMIASIQRMNDLIKDAHSAPSHRQPNDIDPIFRSYKKKYFVVIGRCYDNISSDGSLPVYPYLMVGMKHVFAPDVGFYCLGTGAAYDYAGRVFYNYFSIGVQDMKVPKYYFKNATTIVLGKKEQ